MAKQRAKPPPSWTPAPAKLLLNRELSGNAKTIYLYLLWRQGQNATAWPSQETIAEDTGVSLSTAQRAIKKLKGQSLIEVRKAHKQGKGHSDHYKVKDLLSSSPKDLTQEPSETWLANCERSQNVAIG